MTHNALTWKNVSIRDGGGMQQGYERKKDGREGRMERGRVTDRLEGRDRWIDGKQVERSTDNG